MQQDHISRAFLGQFASCYQSNQPHLIPPPSFTFQTPADFYLLAFYDFLHSDGNIVLVRSAFQSVAHGNHEKTTMLALKRQYLIQFLHQFKYVFPVMNKE